LWFFLSAAAPLRPFPVFSVFPVNPRPGLGAAFLVSLSGPFLGLKIVCE
jgi:hypothetical protein